MNFSDLMSITGNTDDCLHLKKKADELRKSLCSYDKSLLEKRNLRLDMGNLSNAPDGRFVIPYKGIDFDCLFKRNTATGKLYVIFNGYREAGQSEPTFKRWSYYKYLDGGMLNIDDPMCKLHHDLGLGWYYGTDDESYCDYIVEIINDFALQNNYGKVVFIASSGGGYAALYCACKIKNSTVIAINPQIRLNLYMRAKEFQTITGLDLTVRDKFERNHLPELIKEAKDTKFILVENAASDADMVQMNDLCAVLGTNYHYGLNLLAPNVLSWVYEGNSNEPHNAQEYYPMFFALRFLAEHFDNAMDFSELYLIFSELWNDHYELIRENQDIIRQKTRRIDCLASSSDLVSESVVFRTIVNTSGTDIPARDTPYNFLVVCDKLEPNSTYKFTVGNVSVLSGETQSFALVIKDELTRTVDLIKNFDIGKNASLLFSTGQETHKKELRIYSGEVGKTNNIALRVGFCQLVKIGIEGK